MTLSKRRQLQEHFLDVFLVLVGAVGAAQGGGGWAINLENVLWPGLQPSPCHAELFHFPEMQLHFRNSFSEQVLLLLFLLKHSNGIFFIVPALGPCRDDLVLHALWGSNGDYPLG